MHSLRYHSFVGQRLCCLIFGVLSTYLNNGPSSVVKGDELPVEILGIPHPFGTNAVILGMINDAVSHRLELVQ